MELFLQVKSMKKFVPSLGIKTVFHNLEDIFPNASFTPSLS